MVSRNSPILHGQLKASHGSVNIRTRPVPHALRDLIHPLSIASNTTVQAYQRDGLFLLYHEVRNASSDYSYVVQTEQFRQHLDLFASIQSNSPHCLSPGITFDDGHISNHDVAAPLLAEYEFTAHFFITTGWTQTRPGYMGWTELQALHRAGHTIGSHGLSHSLLTRLNDTELQRELLQPRLMLEDKLGISVNTMSLPGGRQNSRILTACAAAGYAHVFTSVPKTAPMPLAATIGRLNILSSMQIEWLKQMLDPQTGILASMERKQRIKDAAKSLLGDRMYEKLWSVANRKEQEPPAA